MAFARRVLEKVPAFDLELGAGPRGLLATETLFSRQLRTAGFRLLAAGEDSTVEHHCGEHRLTRSCPDGCPHAAGTQPGLHRLPLEASHASGSPRFTAEGRCWGFAGCGFCSGCCGDRNPVIGRREARWLWRWSYYRQMKIESQRPRSTSGSGWKSWLLPLPAGCLGPAETPRGVMARRTEVPAVSSPWFTRAAGTAAARQASARYAG